MTTTNKLDLRTCPPHELFAWVEREFPTLRIPGPYLSFYEWYQAHPLEAAAAVEAKAREGRLSGWNVEWWRSAQNLNHECPFFCGWYGTNEETYYRSAEVHAPTEPEARLRAVALALDAAKEGA